MNMDLQTHLGSYHSILTLARKIHVPYTILIFKCTYVYIKKKNEKTSICCANFYTKKLLIYQKNWEQYF